MTIFDDSWDDGWDDEYLDGEDDLEEDELRAAQLGRVPQAWALLESVDEVHEHLLDVVGPERDGPRTLWIQFIDGQDRALPLILPISELPTIVNPEMVANVARVVQVALAGNGSGGSVAFALVRRGGGDRGTFEAGWSRALTEEMAKLAVPVRAIVAIGPNRSRVLSGIGT